jgi:hypothetical protein
MSAPGSQPTFVGGCGRSGTTLVVDLLGMHSRLAPVYETSFVLDLLPLLFRSRLPREVVVDRVRAYMADWTRDLPHRPHEKRDYERYWHGPHHVLFSREFAWMQTEALLNGYLAGDAEASFRRFVRALFAEHAQLAGKPAWINKTPRYVLMLNSMRHLFPDMLFVNCLRDPHDAVSSMLTRSWGPRNAAEGARFWLDCVEKAEAFRRQAPEQYLEIRYEALLAAPRDVLAAALPRLGLADEAETMLARYSERIALRPPAEHPRNPAFAAEVDRIAGAAMLRLGYR